MKIHVLLGDAAPPLSEQLVGLLDEKTLSQFDQDHDAINRLHLRGIISEKQFKFALGKLKKNIKIALKKR